MCDNLVAPAYEVRGGQYPLSLHLFVKETFSWVSIVR